MTALVFNLAVFGIELAIFTFIRPYFKAIYEPRTYVPRPEYANISYDADSSPNFSLRKRINPLSNSMFTWPLSLFRSDYRDIISANGLDAYFFVRFLRVMTFTFLPIWLISWVILMPVDAVKTGFPGASGLDFFTYGNIDGNNQARYAAHLILVYFFTCEFDQFTVLISMFIFPTDSLDPL